jgi:hypothetical protein
MSGKSKPTVKPKLNIQLGEEGSSSARRKSFRSTGSKTFAHAEEDDLSMLDFEKPEEVNRLSTSNKLGKRPTREGYDGIQALDVNFFKMTDNLEK